MSIPKDLLCLAGEHRVASELCKRAVFATITPGNRKQTDLYAISDVTKRFFRIEVKTSQSPSRKFVMGGRQFVDSIVQNKNGLPPDFWVLVQINPEGERFFVLTNDEIEALQKSRNDGYFEKYRAKHGKEYTGRGVDNLLFEQVKQHENRWDKIIAATGEARATA